VVRLGQPEGGGGRGHAGEVGAGVVGRLVALAQSDTWLAGPGDGPRGPSP
jgi:hypothetical protein